MIELDRRALMHIKDIAENGTYDCLYKDCKKCMLSCFNNEKISCQNIAKELLKLLAGQEKENE